MFDVETANRKNILPLGNKYVFHTEGQDGKLATAHVSNRITQPCPDAHGDDTVGSVVEPGTDAEVPGPAAPSRQLLHLGTRL